MLPQYLAIDLGAESGRVISGRFDGETIRLEELHRFPNRPAQVNGTLYWDVLRLWNDISDGLAKAASDGEVLGIGADTWGVDFALLDARGHMLSNPVCYRDERHAGYIERAAQIVPKREIYERTGLQFLGFNTLYQLLALKDQNPRELEAAQTLLFMPDLLHFWLSGERTNEYTIASTSQMLEAREGKWDKELLAQFDLPTDLLAPLYDPGERIGTLRPEIAAKLGLSAKTPIITPGGHDTASAVAAVPFAKPNEPAAYLSSGTWSLMGLELPAQTINGSYGSTPIINDQSFELGFTNEGGAFGSIRFLKNIAGLWLLQECRRDFLARGREFSYAELAQKAREAASDGPFVEPDEARFASPGNMPQKIADYCRETGQTSPQSEGEFARCCLDSLALKYRWAFEKLELLGNRKLETLYIVGGGSQNELLNQLTADCLGRPVVAGPVEATAAGNILLQALAHNQIKNEKQLRSVVRASFDLKRFEPNPAEKPRWDEKFAHFETLLS